ESRKHLSSTPSVGKSLGNAVSFSIGVVLCFSLDPCEFFRIGYDTNRLNTPLLDFNTQHHERLSAHAYDQRGLAVDLRHLRLRARWRHKAVASAHAKACHRFTPSQRARGRSFDLPAPIGPQRHIFGEQV